MLDCILKTVALLIQNITYLGTMLYLAGQHTKKLFSMRFTLCFVIYTSILYIMQLYDNTWLVTAFFIILCLYTVIIKINTGCVLSKSLNIATFGYVFVSIIQTVFIFILKLFNLEVDTDNISNPITFLSMLLTLIATILICYIFPIKNLLSKMQRLPTKEDSKSESHKFTMKIENPGPIITDELTHSLFTKHYTTKTQSTGHGLGLSILKSTIEKHNGTITLSNTYPLGKDTPYFCIEITV